MCAEVEKATRTEGILKLTRGGRGSESMRCLRRMNSDGDLPWLPSACVTKIAHESAEKGRAWQGDMARGHGKGAWQGDSARGHGAQAKGHVLHRALAQVWQMQGKNARQVAAAYT